MTEVRKEKKKKNRVEIVIILVQLFKERLQLTSFNYTGCFKKIDKIGRTIV